MDPDHFELVLHTQWPGLGYLIFRHLMLLCEHCQDLFTELHLGVLFLLPSLFLTAFLFIRTGNVLYDFPLSWLSLLASAQWHASALVQLHTIRHCHVHLSLVHFIRLGKDYHRFIRWVIIWLDCSLVKRGTWFDLVQFLLKLFKFAGLFTHCLLGLIHIYF